MRTIFAEYDKYTADAASAADAAVALCRASA